MKTNFISSKFDRRYIDIPPSANDLDDVEILAHCRAYLVLDALSPGVDIQSIDRYHELSLELPEPLIQLIFRR